MSYEEELAKDIAKLTHDPLGFVYYAFPWGEGELEGFDGPDKWQRDVLQRVGDELRAGGDAGCIIQEAASTGHGSGKGYRLTTDSFKILVDSQGNAERIVKTKWGDMKIGDYVYGQDGKPTKIIGTNHYRREHYRVTFDDGSSTVVSGEHEWNVRGRGERRFNKVGWRTLETQEILKLGVLRKNGKAMAKQWEIPTCEPVEFPFTAVYSPYTIGVWLGDGSSTSASIASRYEELWDELGVAPNKDTKRYRADMQLVASPPGLHEALTKHGMMPTTSDNKYVPEIYKMNNIKVRRDVLRGLLDTDGETTTSGSIGFSSTSKQLVEDVIYLARSLGGKAMLQKAVKQGAYKKDGVKHICKDCYRCTINFGDKWNPFTVHHKKDGLSKSVEHRYTCRWIESIEPVGMADGMCITVEAKDHLYLTNDFIVTHNSCLVSWLILWAMSTMADTKGVVTANTENQLKTKTWAEMAKWTRLCIVSHWFELTATGFFSKDPKYEKTWRMDVIPWSEKNTEAFAGLHNKGKRILVIFDEASSIPDIIWEVAEGAMTDKDTEILWFAFGNPTKNTGRFRECFGKFRHRWGGTKVDCRTAKMTNKEKIQEWIDDYGIQSDFVKVRVLGEFPQAGTDQFIPTALVEDAMEREVDVPFGAPKIFGVDVARYGEDSTVITRIHGRKLEEIHEYKGLDTMAVAAKVAELWNIYKPDHVLVDAIGIGAGVLDRLKQLGFDPIEVISSQKADDERQFFNKRVEMWSRMREWLRHASVPSDTKLKDDLVGISYGHDAKSRLQLEKKSDMKKRGLSSPDRGDSLAQCFAFDTPPVKHTSLEDLLPEWTEDF